MLIYDIEIKKAIQNRNEARIPGIEYCAGWHDHENMGISVICVYDYVERRFRVFMDDNMDDFRELLKKRRPIVGFNSIAFDNQVCAPNGIEIKEEDSYDILVEIWKAAGLAPKFKYPTHIGYGLDIVGAVNFNVRKSGNGAFAPVLWQQGKVGEVVDYCLNDVNMTKLALDQIIAAGSLIDPKTGRPLKIVAPAAILVESLLSGDSG